MSRLPGTRDKAGVICTALIFFAGIASTPPPSLASGDETTIFDPGTAILFESAEARTRDLLEMNAVGTDVVRVVVPWRSIAPNPNAHNRPRDFDATDPAAYPDGAFATLDQTVRGAHVLGMSVLMTPSAPIPGWGGATGNSTVNEPVASEYQAFVEALGHRYSGSYGRDATHQAGCPLLLCPPPSDHGPISRVNHWALWNEPNIGVFLGPQFKNGHPYSPILYRRLYLAGRDGLADSGHRSDQVLIGETATSGGRTGINPLDFARGVFCMDSRFGPPHSCDPLQASGFAHHPYGYSTPPQLLSPNRNLIDLANLGRLTRLMARAYEVGATSSMLDVYITEFGVLSDPHPAGFSPVRQATDMAAAEYLAWRNPRVAAFGQYLLRDDPPQNAIVFTSGLRYADNAPKPLRRSFPVTLLARRISRGSVHLWGHVRSAGGRVHASAWTRRPGGSPTRLRVVRTDSQGYFEFDAPFRRGLRWQARALLRDGRVLHGPFLPSLRFRLPH